MFRREFLTKTMLLGVVGLTVSTPRLYGATLEPHSEGCWSTLQAEGGWDVSNFCDPKVNQSGEKEITNWSKTNEIEIAGNILTHPSQRTVGSSKNTIAKCWSMRTQQTLTQQGFCTIGVAEMQKDSPH